jgi:hypothetical protein
MFYNKEDMQRLSGYEDAELTPFEVTTCKALAFGDNLALCVAFETMARQVHALDDKLSEAKENNIPEAADIDPSMIAVALLTAMAPVIIEV